MPIRTQLTALLPNKPGALARLSVVSVDAFKRRAEERGYTITLDQLPPPEPNSTAPSVVLP